MKLVLLLVASIFLISCQNQQILQITPNFINKQKIPESTSELIPESINLQQIAILLPLTGELTNSTNSIIEGFLTVYYKNLAKNQPTLKFYDSNQDLKYIYQQAIEDGADAIIGPLRPQKVAEIFSYHNSNLPLLALNFNENITGNNKFYQFGISFTNEAKFIAEKTYQQGFKKVLIISSGQAWAQNIKNSFMQNSTQNIVAEINNIENINLANIIKSTLKINESEQRIRNLKNMLANSNIKSKPRRRQDIDMIFIITSPEKISQITPIINYNYAGTLPIYSTSIGYDFSQNTNNVDMKNVIFSKTSLTLSKDKINQLLTTNIDLSLYTLGIDSYYLAMSLPYLHKNTEIASETGNIYIDENYKINRNIIMK